MVIVLGVFEPAALTTSDRLWRFPEPEEEDAED